MRKCKNCSKQRSTKKYRNTHTPEYQITEYGLAKIVSTPKIVVFNDQYMLEVLFKNQKKTKKLDKQVKKINSKIKNLQRSLEKSNMERRNQRNSHDYSSSINEQILVGSKRAKSRTSSVNSSKNREIGRFTRVTEGESQSFSKHSLKQVIPQSIANQTNKKNHPADLYDSKISKRERRSDSVTFAEEVSNNYMLNFPKSPHKDFHIEKRKQRPFEPIFQQRSQPNRNDKKDALLKYTSKPQHQEVVDPSESLSFSKNEKSGQKRNSHLKKSQKNSIQMYIPSYQQPDNSFSSNLLLSEESQGQSSNARHQRDFEQLIILQKSAPQEQKKIIRQEIKALTKMLNIKD